MGVILQLGSAPQRIVSLVPSQTELLVDLGLSDRLVGVTKFCIHPKGLTQAKTVVGGTKNIHLDRITGLHPDLVVGNKEENEQGSIRALQQSLPVWMSDIYTLPDALGMIADLGELLEVRARALALSDKIKEGFSRIAFRRKPIRALYLIWKKPYMAAGSNTFIDDMLQRAGFANVVKEARYPGLTAEQIADLDPEVVFLSSEPYPFADKHKAEFREFLSSAQIEVIDGELFSWYGSRLVHAPAYFDQLYQQLS